MTVIKCKQEYRALLDFSGTERLTKNSVKKLLLNSEVCSYKRIDDQIIYSTYEVNVGMYKIRLLLDLAPYYREFDTPKISECSSNKMLADCGTFYIELYEKYNDSYKHIATDKDNRFKKEYWSPYFKGMHINDLTNIILYCNRLHQLKVFL